jgi:hypothetical protein
VLTAALTAISLVLIAALGRVHDQPHPHEVSYAFTTRTFVQGLVQYNDRADLWSMNMRFGWLQDANTGLFVVYTDTRGLYELSDRPERTDRSFVVKYSRLFDLLR